MKSSPPRRSLLKMGRRKKNPLSKSEKWLNNFDKD
jgi:hypothetical protein